jgi:hypothetical protein
MMMLLKTDVKLMYEIANATMASASDEQQLEIAPTRAPPMHMNQTVP